MTSPVASVWSLRCAALLLALVGLFAMHGLGEHGTHDAGSDHGSMATMATTAMATTTVTAGHAEHAGQVADGLAPALPAGSGVPMAAGAMCLAVLGLVLLAGLLLVRAARRRPLWTRSTRPPRAPVARGRAPDPPGRFVLSVQRC